MENQAGMVVVVVVVVMVGGSVKWGWGEGGLQS